MTPLSQWAKANGTQLRIQNYGMPPATIASAAPADLPEGEGPQWKVVRASRYASSASHIYGRTVTSSETWTWLHSPAFRATPLDVKAEADLHFLQGINQLIGHGWPYNPPDSIYPGTRFYAAGVFNDRNPWWIVMPDLSLYLQRVSYLLRQGRPANDVALYLPNADAWASFRPGQVHLIETLRERGGPKIMPAILEGGYNLDFFDDGSLATRGRVEGNRLFLGENGYRVVVLPGVPTEAIAAWWTLACPALDRLSGRLPREPLGLPLPEGPTSASNSPLAQVSSTSSGIGADWSSRTSSMVSRARAGAWRAGAPGSART